MKLIVFGHKRHGKDTACEFLEMHYGIVFASSSYVACEKFIFERMREKHGYQTVDDCFDDRDNHRQAWYDMICEYNAKDATRLAKVIFSEADVYCGIRSRAEFEALREADMFDLAIWIDAGGRLPPESSDSMDLNENDADIIIQNNGTHEEFFAKLKRVYDFIV